MTTKQPTGVINVSQSKNPITSQPQLELESHTPLKHSENSVKCIPNDSSVTTKFNWNFGHPI